MDIIYKDSEIIVVNKGAGVPVQTKSITQKDLESELKKLLVSEGIKNPYLAVINRLDSLI